MVDRYRMYLVDSNTTLEHTSTPVTFICSDGKVTGDLSILKKYSKTLCEIIQMDCKSCGQSVSLPDVTILTVRQTQELLSAGQTMVGSMEERNMVMELQVALGCSGKSKIEPVLTTGQCRYCFKYNYFL